MCAMQIDRVTMEATELSPNKGTGAGAGCFTGLRGACNLRGGGGTHAFSAAATAGVGAGLVPGSGAAGAAPPATRVAAADAAATAAVTFVVLTSSLRPTTPTAPPSPAPVTSQTPHDHTSASTPLKMLWQTIWALNNKYSCSQTRVSFAWSLCSHGYPPSHPTAYRPGPDHPSTHHSC